MEQCYPVLVGPDTPKGQFTLVQRYTDQAGYGGDVLKFQEEDDYIFSIHRVWLLKPNQKRLERLQSVNTKDRVTITSVCINLMPEVYTKLVDCCSNETLIIK